MRVILLLRSVVGVMLIYSSVAVTPAIASRFEALFAPGARLWDRWTAHDASDTRTVDHRLWHTFLMPHVMRGSDGVHLVAYAKIDANDKRAFERYLGALASTPISTYNRAEQRAYWINLYNALTAINDIGLDKYV